MDRDKRWERIKIALDGLVKGEGEKVDDIVKAIEEKYKVDETDEFLKPLIVNGDSGRIKGQSQQAISFSLLSNTLNLDRRGYSVFLQLPFRPYARNRVRPRSSRQTHGSGCTQRSRGYSIFCSLKH